MKKIMLFSALFAIAQIAFAQASKVPEAVKMSFSKAYPSADDEEWELEDGNFEVEFEMDDEQEMSILYDANGRLLQTEVEITFSEFPKPVQAALKGKKVKEATKITNSKGMVVYEAELRRKELLFNAQGQQIQ